MDTFNVEIVLKDRSTICESEIIQMCITYLSNHEIPPGTVLSNFSQTRELIIYEEVDHILVEEKEDYNLPINYKSNSVNWYVYRLNKTGPQMDFCEDSDENAVCLATHHILPSLEIFNLWESLIYENNIKQNLLNYAYTMMEFMDKRVNSNIISCNKVILLHGPPGTGKTSLCKALSQKLAIRLKHKFKQCILIEINSHSLFSKWFSESSKLVTKLFIKIREAIGIPKTLVCVLIDEIESLAHAREKCLTGNEPSDSIKVVNTVLTQIDRIKRYENVIIFTTSNMTNAIDVAFVDRADVKQYIGPPGEKAIQEIYLSCIAELIKAKIINHYNDTVFDMDEEDLKLLGKVSRESISLSGRMLRKIPFLAHALYLKKENATLNEYLEAMLKAIRFECSQRNHF